MNKTPQEQAEEMAVDISLELTAQNRYSLVIGDCDSPVSKVDYANTAAWLLRKIPLPELIAVAQAAKQYAGLVSECCMTGDRTGEVCDLHCALEALRATGKVEL